MDELDKQLLDLLQVEFPVESRPFLRLACRLNCREDQLLDRVNRLRAEGVIRGIGPVFDAARLGYASTLVAARVPLETLEGFVHAVNALPGVSHHYARWHDLNLWFTLTLRHKRGIDATLARLRHDHKVNSLFSLPAVKTYKIQVRFTFQEPVPPVSPCPAPLPLAEGPPAEFVPDEFNVRLVRELQEDLPIAAVPFDLVAARLDIAPDQLMRTLSVWQRAGIIRRFGAHIRHRLAGYAGNALAVFQVAPADLDRAGAALARYPQVSHCYQRVTVPSWPYNLYAMTHGHTEAQVREQVRTMVDTLRPEAHDCLFTREEYKKERVKFFLGEPDASW